MKLSGTEMISVGGAVPGSRLVQGLASDCGWITGKLESIPFEIAPERRGPARCNNRTQARLFIEGCGLEIIRYKS
jgi:hypothetical protein